MKRFLAIMNTTAARLSALYLVLFTLCSIFLVFYMTGVAARFLTADTRSEIVAQLNTLDRDFRRGGMRRLLFEVERRSRGPGANLYILTDASGRILSGNVFAIEPGVMDEFGWRNRPFTYARFSDESDVLGQPDRAPRAIAQVSRLPNGMRLLVGRDIGEPERFRQIIRRALALALLIMGIGATLIWLFVGRRALKRIDAISIASNRILAGDLSGRLPVSKANDEFDRLSAGLNTMLERISTLNDGLREVSDSIAHDLKTPLTRLQNRAAAAFSKAERGEATQEDIASILGESDQIIRIFNALLLISRVESGYTKKQFEAVDLTEVATDIGDLYGPSAEEAGVSLGVQADEAVFVHGNRELIGQAMTNLIENALKYGAVEDGLKKREVAVSVSRAQNRMAILRVTDNGPGIPDADKNHVLQRFVRLDESRSKPGSGLGLSLVSAIVSLHNGTMKLMDAEPGLTVEIQFPIVD
ncbi:MAG: HAMP domain-containing sensor histidine kinase [Pseudomonadota bacterium]